VTSDQIDKAFAKRLATLISWICHPLVFVTATVATVVMTQLASRTAWSILAAIFLSVIAPTAIMLLLGVRSGRWKDADVSVREERKRFYPIAIPLSAFGTLMTWLVGAPGYILRGGIATLLLLAVAATTNLWFKISLHTLFVSYCSIILLRVNPICGAVAFLLTALVFWSRLVLGRHTFPETIVGTLLGVLGGIATAWL
jgi:membrane-associated phospholipid phosphatase